MYQNFVRIDEFLLDFITQTNTQIDRQTNFNFSHSKKLTILPKWKKDLSNKEKIIKIGAFFQKLSWNEGIAFTKVLEKNR